MAKGALALSGLGGCFLFGSEFRIGFDLCLAWHVEFGPDLGDLADRVNRLVCFRLDFVETFPNRTGCRGMVR